MKLLKKFRKHPILTTLLFGYGFTVSYEIRHYECRPFEVEYNTCTSGAIASGLMQGMVWPFYWVAKTREQQ